MPTWHCGAVITGEVIETVEPGICFVSRQAAWEVAPTPGCSSTHINWWHTAPTPTASTAVILVASTCISTTRVQPGESQPLTFMEETGRLTWMGSEPPRGRFHGQEILVGNADYPTEKIARTPGASASSASAMPPGRLLMSEGRPTTPMAAGPGRAP